MPDRPHDETPKGYGPPDDAMTYDETGDEAGRGRMVLALAVVMVVAAVAILYVVFQQGVRKGGRNAPPVIVAEVGPEKIKPDDPGGLNVPHQDKLVYDRVSGETTERVEKLLPEPEEPIDLSGLRTNNKADPIELATADKAVVSPMNEEIIETRGADDSSAAPVLPKQKPTENPPVSKIETKEPTRQPIVEKPIAEAESIGDLIDTLPEATKDPIGTLVADVDPGTVNRASGGIEPATSGAYVVQVSSVQGADLATREWEVLLRKFGDLLTNLRPDIQMADLGAKGIYYRLRIGPFATKQEAQDMCSTLKSRGRDCLVRKT
jgi:sporulation related protein